MKQVQAEELSALLDGELSAERAAEVQVQIAADPALRADYAALARLDAWARASAGAAAFTPTVRLPALAQAVGWGWIMAGALVLLLVRFVPKVAVMATPGLWLQLGVCAVVLIVVVRLARAAPAVR
jgi:anti-sigma factor RsiW